MWNSLCLYLISIYGCLYCLGFSELPGSILHSCFLSCVPVTARTSLKCSQGYLLFVLFTSVWSVSTDTKLIDYFLDCVQSNSDPIKGILHFCSSPPCRCRDQAVGPSSTTFPSTLAESWIWSKAARTLTGPHVGCQHCRQRLSLLHHCACPPIPCYTQILGFFLLWH